MLVSATRNLLLLLAVTLLAFPVLAPPSCEMIGHDADASCETTDCFCAHITAGAPEDASPVDDCCADGCQDCGLRCCSGGASVLTSAPNLSTNACVRTQPLLVASDLSLADLDPVYHPPRD